MIITKFLKHQILKQVEWLDNSKDTIVYRVPMDGRAIQMGSKLIVRESQMAVFVNKGQVADVFSPGMHTLSTSNLPFLTTLLSLPFGFKSPFTCEIYFVNTKQFANQKWGTQNPITMRDKEFGMIRIKGFGAYTFRVNEPLTFLKELFSTNSTFKTEDIDDLLKSLIITGLTETIASSGVSALDMSANLYEFANLSKPIVNEKFKTMGLKLEQFNIENLSFPEEVERAIDARSAVGIMGDKVDTHMKMSTAAAMRDAANNQGTAGAGFGFGMGMAMSSGGPGGGLYGGGAIADNHLCPKCKTVVKNGVKFCQNCGTVQVDPKSNKGESTFCGNCGASVPPGAKFCNNCGQKQ